MFWFLIRLIFVLLIVFLAYRMVDGGYRAVKQHYSWMHPDPSSIR